MKNTLQKIVLLTLLWIGAQGAQGQNRDTKVWQNEIGLGYRIPPIQAGSSGTEIGGDVMYKKFLKSNRAIRVLAGFQNQIFPQGKSAYWVVGDTLTMSTPQRQAGTFFAGARVQLQRPIFRRLVLTGAIDTRFHLGRGSADANEKRILLSNQKELDMRSTWVGGFSAFRWDLYPALGIRMDMKRIALGFEVISRFIQYNRHTPYSRAVPPMSQMDADFGQMMSRLSLSYRW